MKWELKYKIKSENRRGRTKEILKAVLVNRGIDSKEKAGEFLRPKHPREFGPAELRIDRGEVEKAFELVEAVKDEGKTVVVYGDYDADGVTATVIMWEFLREVGLVVKTYVPERRSEGYGMKVGSLRRLLGENANLGLVVTVDQGIVAYEAAEYLREKGVKLLVTDHHQEGEEKLKADSVIHTTDTSGSGVAWWLTEWLRGRLGMRREGSLEELAAIGTVADMLPLLGVNRSLVVHGLEGMKRTDRVGLKKLIEIAGLELENLEAHHIGFVLAPRINAMGRLEHAGESLQLLSEELEDKAIELAKRLDEVNRRRQELTSKMMEQALDMVDKPGRLIFIDDEGFDEGVVGLVAAKLVEKFYRPAVVVARGKGLSKASCRSIQGYNIVEALRQAEQLMEGVGGHEMAAGFSINTSNIDSLRERLMEHAEEVLSDNDLIPRLEIDCQVELGDLSFDLMKIIEKLAPFGVGNSRPVLATRGMRVVGVRAVGRESKHLKLQLGDDGGGMIGAIGFGLGERAKDLKPGDVVDVAYNLSENEWNGRVSLEMKVKDLKTR
jgi:single-stranded-DNA-specific exonuclease